MKKFALVTAGLCAALTLVACNSAEKKTAAGAMGEKSACCTDDKKCDAKCTGDTKTCTKTFIKPCTTKLCTTKPCTTR